MSPEVTARTGMDALCQCIEAYTSTGANPMTGALALEGISRAARSLERAYLNVADVEAREDMALAALYSGIALTNAGLGGGAWVCSAAGGEFSGAARDGVCGVAGAGDGGECGGVARKWWGGEVGAVCHGGAEADRAGGIGDEEAIEEGVTFVRRLREELDIPRLGMFGITPNDLAAIVALAQKSSSMRSNPVGLAADRLSNILAEAL